MANGVTASNAQNVIISSRYLYQLLGQWGQILIAALLTMLGLMRLRRIRD